MNVFVNVLSCKNNILSTWYGFRGLHQVGLTKRFEHCRLLSVSRFCPVNNISKFCKHLCLKTRDPQSYFSPNIFCKSECETVRKHSDRLTPESMMSPDSAIAPSLLSAYTTASFINTSSSSRQFGLQAPTAAQQQQGSRLTVKQSAEKLFF